MQNKNKNSFNFDFNNRNALYIVLGLSLIIFLMFSVTSEKQSSEIPYSQFIRYLESGQLESVTIIDQHQINGVYMDRNGEQYSFKSNIPYFDNSLMDLLRDSKVLTTGDVSGISPGRVILELIPWILIFGFMFFSFRQIQGGGSKAFSFGRSKAKRYDEESKKITFADVAGQEEAKYELQEVVEFLKTPQKFSKIGARIPKGVLLVGSPGTGKTLLAKAVAGESGVPFFHMSGSDFVEMFVGVGASRVRDLFEQGRKNAPCILFIDELDAVGRTRGAGLGGGNDEREQTLNQMLVEMDGFETKDGVILIAATNRPDVLDPALLRPGRFDRQVVIDLPDVREREAILKIHAMKINMSASTDLTIIAKATPGSSGADLANIVNEAALFAARKGKSETEMTDFEEARDKILMGVARRSRLISEKDKRMTACHEAGHALLHYYLDNADPLHKVTIIPRGRALGVTFSLPESDVLSRSSGWLDDRICISYGGFVAENLVYSETTTGAQNDIVQATDIARKMVCEWGMSSVLGPVSFSQSDEPIFLGKEISRHKDYSEETAVKIDQEMQVILNKGLNRAETILTVHRDELDLLTEELIQHETLDDRDIQKLLKRIE